MAKCRAGGVLVSIMQRRAGAEALTSFVLACEAILLWNVVIPFVGVIERVIRQPGPWSQLLGTLALCVSYYFLLSITLPVGRRYNPNIHPISLAYLGGWWLVVLLAALSVQSAAFNNVLGLSMATSGANLVFITLFVGLAKYWIDGYRNPPKAPEPGTVESPSSVPPVSETTPNAVRNANPDAGQSMGQGAGPNVAGQSEDARQGVGPKEASRPQEAGNDRSA